MRLHPLEKKKKEKEKKEKRKRKRKKKKEKRKKKKLLLIFPKDFSFQMTSELSDVHCQNSNGTYHSPSVFTSHSLPVLKLVMGKPV